MALPKLLFSSLVFPYAGKSDEARSFKNITKEHQVSAMCYNKHLCS